MTMFRRLLVLLMLGFAGVVLGSAASLTMTSVSLGAATVTTPRCTNAGLSVLQNLSGSNVASVTVTSLPVACGGATLQVTVNNGTTTGSGSASVPAGGGSVTVSLSATPAVSAVEQTDIVLVGP